MGDLVDAEDEAMVVTGSCRRVGEQLGINIVTLRNWAKPALIDDGERPRFTMSDRARLVELEREVRELRGAHAIPKTRSWRRLTRPVARSSQDGLASP